MTAHWCAGALPALHDERDALSARLNAVAVELSSRRRVACGELRVAVEACLKQLAMPHSRFDVRVAWELDAGRAGDDSGAAQSLLVDERSAGLLGACVTAPTCLPSTHCSRLHAHVREIASYLALTMAIRVQASSAASGIGCRPQGWTASSSCLRLGPLNHCARCAPWRPAARAAESCWP